MMQASARELEILRLAASGRSRREIAQALVLSDLTIKSHLARCARRNPTLGNTTGLVAQAIREGLIHGAPHECEQPTERELAVLQGCARGWQLERVARDIYISVDTAKTHLRRSGNGLHVRGRTAQVALCLTKGWID